MFEDCETKFSNFDDHESFSDIDGKKSNGKSKFSYRFGSKPLVQCKVLTLIIIVTLAMCFILVCAIGTVIILNTKDNDNSSLSTNMSCFSCAKIQRAYQGSSINLEDFATRQKDGNCCITDMEQGFIALLQTIEVIPDPFISRLDEMKGCAQDVNISSDTPRQDNDDNTTSSSPQNYLYYQKASIHLQGTFDKSRRRMRWRNRVHLCGIMLTQDSMAIQISATANYYMYGSIFFTSRVTSRTTHFMYQQSRNGVAQIEHLEKYSIPQEEINGEVCSIQRVVYLHKGDQLFVSISSNQTQLVSTEADIHVWGMFEI